jgi:hypothetical protein
MPARLPLSGHPSCMILGIAAIKTSTPQIRMNEASPVNPIGRNVWAYTVYCGWHLQQCSEGKP